MIRHCCSAGGRDTAGLGGKGGPYRLDAGHKVYQVSQAEKDAVPEEVRRAARDMAEQAFKDRCVHVLRPLQRGQTMARGPNLVRCFALIGPEAIFNGC